MTTNLDPVVAKLQHIAATLTERGTPGQLPQQLRTLAAELQAGTAPIANAATAVGQLLADATELFVQLDEHCAVLGTRCEQLKRRAAQRRLQARLGRHAGPVLVAMRSVSVDDTVRTLRAIVGGRAALLAALDSADDTAVRAALLAALDALAELHAIETHAPIRQENTGLSDGVGSRFAAHPPPTLTRCTHHRRHLAALSTTDADPAPMHHAGAMRLRFSPCIGGC